MTDAIPFNRVLNLTPGAVDEVVPGVRRILADNPGPFTFKGTLSYIIGRGKVAIVDPGPDDAAHRAALLDAVRGESVTHIIITHTHRDHSPGAAAIKAATGAPTFAEGPHRPARPLHLGETSRLDAGGDTAFMPDHRVAHGDVIAGDGWALEVVATPGHTANHMAYALKGTEVLFSGDHVMGWSHLDRRAAGRGHARLHGLAPSARGAARDRVSRRPWRCDPRRAGSGCPLHRASPRPRSRDPARPWRRRNRHRGLGAGDLCRTRPAACWSRRTVRAGASGRSGRARSCSTDGAPSLSGRYRLPD